MSMRESLKLFAACLGFLVSVSVSANTKVFCQSELLKKQMSAPWSEAMFYNSEFFEITISKSDQAQLIEKSLGVAKCETTSVQINCLFKDKKNSASWSVSRITGSYEAFYQYESGERSKTRGRCARKEQLLF